MRICCFCVLSTGNSMMSTGGMNIGGRRSDRTPVCDTDFSGLFRVSPASTLYCGPEIVLLDDNTLGPVSASYSKFKNLSNSTISHRKRYIYMDIAASKTGIFQFSHYSTYIGLTSVLLLFKSAQPRKTGCPWNSFSISCSSCHKAN